MLRLLTDENFNANIVRGLRLHVPQLDIVSVKQMGLDGSPDPTLLKWAAQKDRAILTHDVSTMIGYATRLLKRGQPMAGVILVPNGVAIGRAVRGLELLLKDLSQSELWNHVRYLPLSSV